jgi:hypothetical protein
MKIFKKIKGTSIADVFGNKSFTKFDDTKGIIRFLKRQNIAQVAILGFGGDATLVIPDKDEKIKDAIKIASLEVAADVYRYVEDYTDADLSEYALSLEKGGHIFTLETFVSEVEGCLSHSVEWHGHYSMYPETGYMYRLKRKERGQLLQYMLEKELDDPYWGNPNNINTFIKKGVFTVNQVIGRYLNICDKGSLNNALVASEGGIEFIKNPLRRAK